MLRQGLTVITVAALLFVVAGCQTCPGARPCCPKSASCPAAEPAPAVGAPYTCHFAASPVTIDGKLDEAAWKKADVISTFYAYQPDNPPSLTPTKVRFLWDDTNLYVCYECEDDDIWSFSDKDDDTLWDGDVGELFIKPSAKSFEYYEFVMAPSGALYDGRYPARGAGGFHRFKGWSSNAKVATSISGTDDDPTDTDKGYVIEVAIPLSAFGASAQPTNGTSWSFGAFRYDYSKSFEQTLLLMSIPEAPSNGYHYYEGYGPLNFVK